MIKKYVIVILLITILFRFTFVLTHINHDCTNDETCHICLIINNYKKDIERINPFISFLLIFIILLFSNNIIKFNSHIINNIDETLIRLKVELNN